MTPGREVDAARLPDLVGTEVGVSEWVEISQEMIDAFADVTDDHQYIHVDPERAGRSPFGTTVAHGFLILSLLVSLRQNALDIQVEGVSTRVNYGFDRVRFTTPVPAGGRIRARYRLSDAAEKSPGKWRLTYGVTVELEGSERPALIAEWVTMVILNG